MAVCALAEADRASAVAAVLLAETTTLGVRQWTVERTVLDREIHTIDTEFGPVRIKVARWADATRARPEFEDCRSIARRDGFALHEVLRRVEAAANAWLEKERS